MNSSGKLILVETLTYSVSNTSNTPWYFLDFALGSYADFIKGMVDQMFNSQLDQQAMLIDDYVVDCIHIEIAVKGGVIKVSMTLTLMFSRGRYRKEASCENTLVNTKWKHIAGRRNSNCGLKCFSVDHLCRSGRCL